MACADSAELVAEFVTMLSRIVTISIPPLTEREDEIDRLLEACGWDAVEELAQAASAFSPAIPNWSATAGSRLSMRSKLSPAGLSRSETGA